jgi:hypothetical protein
MEIRGRKVTFLSNGEMEIGEPVVVGKIPSPVDLIKAELQKEGIVFAELHGKTGTTSREAQKAFSGSTNVLLASVESGGTGINLDDTKGDNPRTEIFMFAPYRGISTVQAMGRIWRASTIQDDNNPNRYAMIVASDIKPDAFRSVVLAKKLQLMNAAIGGTAVSRLPMAKTSYDPKQLQGLEIAEEGEESSVERPRTGILKPIKVNWKPANSGRYWSPASADVLEWEERGGAERVGIDVRVFKGNTGWVVTSDKPYKPEDFTLPEVEAEPTPPPDTTERFQAPTNSSKPIELTLSPSELSFAEWLIGGPMSEVESMSEILDRDVTEDELLRIENGKLVIPSSDMAEDAIYRLVDQISDMTYDAETDLTLTPQKSASQRRVAKKLADRIQEAMGDIRYQAPSKSVTDRSPSIRAAAIEYRDGKITQQEYLDIVKAESPARLFTEVPAPAPNDSLPEGTRVGLRLDIPVFRDHGVGAVTIHQPRGSVDKGTAGSPIGYGAVAHVKNARFATNSTEALKIATGEAKQPLATIEGEWVPSTPESVSQAAQAAINDPAWVQVGMNPIKHSWFYDRADMRPVISADEVLQVGGAVFAKNPVYASPTDPRFMTKGGVLFQGKGGRPQGAKGSAQLTPEGKALLKGLENPDFTTGMHELWHAFEMAGYPGWTDAEIAQFKREVGDKTKGRTMMETKGSEHANQRFGHRR